MIQHKEHSIMAPSLIRGMDHVGITVPDLDAAIRFFCEVLGCRLVHSRAPTAWADPAKSRDAARFVTENLGAHEDTTVAGIAMLRCGHGPNIELFDYRCSNRREEPPNNADIGGHHLGFYTDDIVAGVEHLKRTGAKILGKIKTVTSGPEEGLSWVYFVSPWGLHMELVSIPSGKGYEKSDPDTKLWAAVAPAS
jgi:catechol 2,3-dioxygenase-like lactoylglutathione lyase family enzyme